MGQSPVLLSVLASNNSFPKIRRFCGWYWGPLQHCNSPMSFTSLTSNKNAINFKQTCENQTPTNCFFFFRKWLFMSFCFSWHRRGCNTIQVLTWPHVGKDIAHITLRNLFVSVIRNLTENILIVTPSNDEADEDVSEEHAISAVPPHFPWCDHPVYSIAWWGIPIMKLFTVQFPLASVTASHLCGGGGRKKGKKKLAQYPILVHLKSVSFP